MTLRNGSFEDRWLTIAGGNQQPWDWTLDWDLPGAPLHAPKAGDGDTQTHVNVTPECVHKLSEQLPEDEQLGGKDALILDGSTTYKMFGSSAFRVTLRQQFDVAPGSKCELVIPVQVHGQLQPSGIPYNIDTGSAYWRLTVNGYPGEWLTFNNDFEDRKWFYLYNDFTAVYGVVDILLEFENHGLSGIDFFIDNVQYSVQDNVPPEPECKGLPREQYERTYNLLPQNATVEQFRLVTAAAYDDRETIGFSADDAGIGDLDKKLVVVWWFAPDSWESEEALNNFFSQYYHGTLIWHAHKYQPDPPPVDPPPIDPPPDFIPTNYVPTGCKTFWHGVGDDGQTDIQQHVMERGASMATAKGLADVGWLRLIKDRDGNTRTVGRFIENSQGVNVEWFNNNIKPIPQAQNRMSDMGSMFGKHGAYVNYWEIMNEEDPPGKAGHINLAEFFIEAMRIADDCDIKLALFSYSMGVPEPAEWDAIATTGIFEIAAAGGHAISLHEYGVWPRDQISLLTRYRYVYETHILPRGLNIPLFITEYAPDAWTLEAFSDDDLMAQLAAYDNELAKDSYVAGAHIFTVGGASGWPQFRERWVRLYGRFEDYVVSVKGRANE